MFSSEFSSGSCRVHASTHKAGGLKGLTVPIRTPRGGDDLCSHQLVDDHVDVHDGTQTHDLVLYRLS